MIDMPTINSIRQQRRDGCSVAEIARRNGVSRDTVYKYLKRDDFSPTPPARQKRPSKLDPYKPLIRQWIEDDSTTWRKQRHTAKRIWQRLVEECGADVSDDTVNPLFANCANESAPIAPTHFHRFRQRTFTVFGYSASLLSRGRSFSR